MNVIASIPPLVRLLIAFVFMLFAIKKKVPLSYAFLGGAIFVGLMFGMSIPALGLSMVYALIDPKTLSLSVVVSLILVFSNSLESTGQMKRMLESFKGLVRYPLINLLIFPALIGLLPMPGGAVFSAPMVRNIGRGHGISDAQLSYTNYWFRHIWEYWWPLYPGVLLTTALANIDLWVFMACQIPLSVVATAVGYWPLRHSLGSLKAEAKNKSAPRDYRTFFTELFPIMLVIVLGIGAGSLFSALPGHPFRGVSKESGLILSLLVAIGLVWRKNRLAAGQCWNIVRQDALVKIFFMIASILIFKGLLADSGAVGQISKELLDWRIPLVLVVAILPFLVGGVAGITIAFVGTTFPILVSLIQSSGQAEFMLPLMALAIVCGFMGVMLSPLHLCLILSNTYFNASLSSVYRELWVPVIAVFVSGGAYFFLIRALMTG